MIALAAQSATGGRRCGRKRPGGSWLQRFRTVDELGPGSLKQVLQITGTIGRGEMRGRDNKPQAAPIVLALAAVALRSPTDETAAAGAVNDSRHRCAHPIRPVSTSDH
jgi:hypothetical protein